ncbi:MAG: hypothetical protein ABI417_12785 [Coleofasciculaceae cyanobacterium]
MMSEQINKSLIRLMQKFRHLAQRRIIIIAPWVLPTITVFN